MPRNSSLRLKIAAATHLAHVVLKNKKKTFILYDTDYFFYSALLYQETKTFPAQQRKRKKQTRRESRGRTIHKARATVHYDPDPITKK